GRVILTTAYESPKAANWQTSIAIASSALALLFLVATVAGFLKKRREELLEGAASAKRASAGWFGTLFDWFTSFVFIFLALLATVGRRSSDLVFARVGLILTKLGLPDMEHLCSMDAGVRAAVWLTSGGIAAFGLAVAVGRVKAHSIWRLIGAGAVLLSVIPFVAFTPPDQWVEEIELWEKLAFIFPALLVAFWHLLNYLDIGYKHGPESPQEGTSARSGRPAATLDALSRMEIRWRHKNVWRFGGLASLCSVGLLAALSMLVFIPPNFFEAQLGVQRVVVCVDMETGDILWEQPVFIAPAERKHSDGTYATPTAAADGSHIAVNFGVGAAGLDFDGKILWRKWDRDYFRNSRYGAAASALLTDDKAIIVQECEDNSDRPTWIAAFDKQTGLTRWRIEPENVRGCYTTPLLYRDNSGRQLIIASLGNVASYDVDSGRFLWMERIPTEQLVASMARAGELLCVGGGTWGQNATVVMRLVDAGGRIRAKTLWRSEQDTPGDCSPVIYAGKLYTVSDKGKMTCYDAVSGELFWNKRLKGSRYLSSLVAGDGKIYACNTRGLTTVIAAEAEFRILAENDLNGRCYASTAIADGCILLRIAGYLYCIEKESQ
ncbi:MAG: PQQ-binding-like beta-propeller repeat protein, partial [Phycisphaerae bacterium]|nr:PQQ-binding-like beta-propeller repeat protein [Phycisphaerae bacterium]